MTAHIPAGDRPLRVARASGVGAILLGALVIAAWYLGVPLLTQVRPTYAPMQFNAALGVMLCGASLSLRAMGWRRLSMLLAVPALVLAAVTLLEMALGLHLGVDQAFFNHEITVRTSHHGRMAPQTALALFGVAASLLLISRARLLAWGIGCAVVGLGTVALLGYAAGVRQAISWGDSTDVALPAAFALVILGSGLIAVASVSERSSRTRLRPSAAYIAGLMCLMATILFWRALVEHQEAQVRRTNRMLAFNAEASLRAYLTSFERALEHMADRWKDLARPTGTEWRYETRLILDRPGGPAAIEWITSSLQVRKRATLVRDSSAADVMAFTTGDATEITLARARERQRAVFTAPFDSPAGFGFRAIVPMVSGGRVRGFVAGYFRVRDLLMAITTDETSESALALLVDGIPAAQTTDWEVASLQGISVERKIDLDDGTSWTLSVAPSKKLLAGTDAVLPGLALLTGLALTMLMTLLVRQVQIATLAARDLRRANRLLNQEIGERRRAEQEIRDLARSLEQRVQERTAALAAANNALRTENRLRERAQATLARANKDLRQFTSFVSHELRQPLASGQIWCDLLESTAGAALDERARTYMSELRASIARIADFLDGQLRLARAAYEDRATPMETVALGEVVGKVTASFERDLESIGGRIDVGCLPVARIDSAQMDQVFRNLIENAIKYRRTNVPLTITIEGEVREDDDEDPVCEIRVRDNGQGFASTEAAEIFEIFRRLDRKVGGSGLGLALCRRVIERHGGAISADGRPGAGATFVITLPGVREETVHAATL